MKKSLSLLLCMMLLATMFVITGCAGKITVEFTVEGVDAYSATFVDTKNVTWSAQRQEDPNNPDAPAIYTFNAPGDGDYEMILLVKNEQPYPFTLKIHNGKVEAVTPEGITVNPTIK